MAYQCTPVGLRNPLGVAPVQVALVQLRSASKVKLLSDPVMDAEHPARSWNVLLRIVVLLIVTVPSRPGPGSRRRGRSHHHRERTGTPGRYRATSVAASFPKDGSTIVTR
jgi:hypothetical protein